MKIRGWLLVAATMVLSAQCAMAASTVDQIVTAVGGGTAAEQQVIVDEFGVLAGTDSAQTLLVDASKGTFLPALTQVSVLNNDVEDAVIDLLGAAQTNGDTGALAIAAGVDAAASVSAGAATASAIGGAGGVIASRQAGLMAERKAMGSVDSALASFKMNENFANRIWASPFYTNQSMDKKDGYDGYDYDAWGASIGYDRAFGSFFLGGAFTYSRGDLDQENIADDNTIDNYGFSLYGQYYNNCNGFFATLTGGYNYGDNQWEARSSGYTFDGDNSTDSWWLGGNVGKDFFIGENWTVTPSIGLFYSSSESSSYTRKANGVNFQNFGKFESESLMMPIDLKVEYTTVLDDCSSVSFNVTGGYAYNWLDDDDARSTGSFQYAGTTANVFVQGVEPGRNSWNIGAGVTYRRNNWDIGLNYRYDGKSKFDAHRVAATVGWNF